MNKFDTKIALKVLPNSNLNDEFDLNVCNVEASCLIETKTSNIHDEIHAKNFPCNRKESCCIPTISQGLSSVSIPKDLNKSFESFILSSRLEVTSVSCVCVPHLGTVLTLFLPVSGTDMAPSTK
jgi:hypothetical protein